MPYGQANFAALVAAGLEARVLCDPLLRIWEMRLL